jgi:hypothetical protein
MGLLDDKVAIATGGTGRIGALTADNNALSTVAISASLKEGRFVHVG